jgi:cell division control protein 6
MQFLNQIYRDVLDGEPSGYMQVCQLIGPVGTGKTATALRFGADVEGEAAKNGVKLRHVYLNGKIEGASRFTLYRSMLDKVTQGLSTRSLSPEELLSRLISYLRENDEYVLITVDEISYFLQRSKEHIVYDLTRLNELTPLEPSPILGVIFIDRDLAFHEMLEKSERSTLGRLIVRFPRYRSSEIRDILELRVNEAFKPGVVDGEVLKYVSEATAKPPIDGDLRVGLDMLLYAGLQAERDGRGTLSLEDVRRVHGATYPGITTADIMCMDEAERLVLWGLLRALRREKKAYVSLRSIRDAYEIICEEQGAEPIEEIEEQVQDLIYMGIVDMKSLTEFGVSGVSIEDLERFLDMIVEKLKRGLDEDEEV